MLKKFLISGLVLFLALGMPLSLPLVHAAVPNIIEYQGKLTDSSGNPLGGTSGANFNFKFSIWDSASGGARLWPGPPPASTTLTVVSGIFDVGLGDASLGFPALNLNFNSATPYYLQVEVWNASSSAFETLTPRQPIESAGFAINSAALNGYTQGTSSNNLLQLNASGSIDLSGGQIRPMNSASCAGLTALGGGSLCYDTTANSLFVYDSASSSWTSFLLASNNLSDLTSTSSARANLGLGNVANALQLAAANNLSDLTNTSTARTNLGFGGGTGITVSSTGVIYLSTSSISQFANDSGYLTSLSGALLAANNLTDLTSTSSARTNLGLGSISTYASSDRAPDWCNVERQGARADRGHLGCQCHQESVMVGFDRESPAHQWCAGVLVTGSANFSAERSASRGRDSVAHLQNLPARPSVCGRDGK